MIDEKWLPKNREKGELITSDELFNMKATTNVSHKEFLNAINLWLKVLDKNKIDSFAWSIIGMLYIHMNEPAKAVKFLDKAIELEPNNPEYWDQLGFAYFNQGNLLKSIDYFQKAINLDYKRKETLNRLSYSYMALGKQEEAKNGFINVLELDPQNVFALNNLGLIYVKLNRFSKAIMYFTEVVSLEDDYIQAWNNLGTCYAMTKNHPKAVECYEKVIELGSQKADHWYNLASSYIDLKQIDKATTTLEKALELNTRDIDIQNKLIEVNLQRKRRGEKSEEEIAQLCLNNPKVVAMVEKLRENPELVFSWKSDQQKMYIRGFFDENGSIFINGSEQVVLAIEHTIPEKIDICHRLLKQFGIHSIVYHNQHTEDLTEPSQLFIVGLKDMQEFYQKIGMELPTKKKRFLEAFDKYLEQVKTNEEN